MSVLAGSTPCMLSRIVAGKVTLSMAAWGEDKRKLTFRTLLALPRASLSRADFNPFFTIIYCNREYNSFQ